MENRRRNRNVSHRLHAGVRRAIAGVIDDANQVVHAVVWDIHST
jgi:hypothetical protein